MELCDLTICSKSPSCAIQAPQACTPALCGFAGCANSEFCQDLIVQCAEVGNCPPDLNCSVELCSLTICSKSPSCVPMASLGKSQASTSNKTEAIKRGFPCPLGILGINCGHGPACTKATCHLEGCATTSVCRNATIKRQFHCPAGKKCGHAPVCVSDLPQKP